MAPRQEHRRDPGLPSQGNTLPSQTRAPSQHSAGARTECRVKHPHPTPAHPVAHPVARCTAFAAVVAIGSLSMSAPASASPVGTTTQSVVTTAGTVTDPLAATPADNGKPLGSTSAAALAEATSTLVQAQHLTDSTSMPAKEAKRIEEAAAEVRELVTASAALADRTERASRSAERTTPPGPADGEAGDDAPVSPDTVSTADLTAATEALAALLQEPAADTVSDVVPGPSDEEIAAKKAEARAKAEAKAAAKAEARRQKAADLAAQADKYGNGRIPGNLLCDLSFARGEELRCDAALAIEELNKAFAKKFGHDLTVNDTYRSYGEQVAVRATRGALAAPPGTSNHGLGQAIDLGGGISTFRSAEYRWMAANAGKFGWIHPAWAEPGGSKPEAWHWEYDTGA